MFIAIFLVTGNISIRIVFLLERIWVIKRIEVNRSRKMVRGF